MATIDTGLVGPSIEHAPSQPDVHAGVEAAQGYLRKQHALSIFNCLNIEPWGWATNFERHDSRHQIMDHAGRMITRMGMAVEVHLESPTTTDNQRHAVMVKSYFIDDSHRPLPEDVITAFDQAQPFRGHRDESFASEMYIG